LLIPGRALVFYETDSRLDLIPEAFGKWQDSQTVAMNLRPNLKQRLLAWLDDGPGTNLPRNHRFVGVPRRFFD